MTKAYSSPIASGERKIMLKYIIFHAIHLLGLILSSDSLCSEACTIQFCYSKVLVKPKMIAWREPKHTWCSNVTFNSNINFN
jgi:hypothetical protein